MAIPTVFVSSTFYDLRYARESMKRFIEQIGYLPVLSEDGTVFYDPKTTAADACLREVSNADMLILLIGGRYGMDMPGGDQSVTNAEYQQAIRDKVPVFALVEQGTFNDYSVYQANSSNPLVLNQLTFPNADSVKIFEFIDTVRSRAANNALVPFRTIADIEAYLRGQWAGMLHDYLSRGTREAQVVDTLTVLTSVNERVELIASQILRTVGTPFDRVYVGLLQTMVESSAVGTLRTLGLRPRPGNLLKSPTAEELAVDLGTPLVDYTRFDDSEDEHAYIVSSGGQLTRTARAELERKYAELRRQLDDVLTQSGFAPENVYEYENQSASVA